MPLWGEGNIATRKTFEPSNTQKNERSEQQEHGKIINNFKIFNNNFCHSNVSVLSFFHVLRQRIKGLQCAEGEKESGITVMRKHGNTRTYV
jgi:hypothetical protein